MSKNETPASATPADKAPGSKTRSPEAQIDLLEDLSELLRKHGASAVLTSIGDSLDCLVDATDGEGVIWTRRTHARAADLRDVADELERVEKRTNLTLAMAAGVLADNGCDHSVEIVSVVHAGGISHHCDACGEEVDEDPDGRRVEDDERRAGA